MRTGVAKRIFGIFIVCALLPIGCLAFFSLREMAGNLEEKSYQQRHQTNKQIAFSLIEGFSVLRAEMEVLALSYGSHRGKPAGDAGKEMPNPWKPRFSGLTFFPEGSGAETVFGTPCPPHPRTEALRNHLESGQAAIFVQRAIGAPSRVLMALAPGGMLGGRGVWVGEVHPKYLRDIVEQSLPAQVDVTLLDSGGEVVYNSRPLPKPVVRRVGRVAPQISPGQFEWVEEGDPLFVNYRTIFLKLVYFEEDWIVIASQSKADAFAPLTRMTTTFLLVTVLTVLVVTLFSIVQIRRNLVPLAKLKEGTRKIRGGDFESRIEVHSGDEFEELAHSFNRMTERLGKEFHALNETGRIVRSVLTGLERETIVKTVLGNLRTVIPCETVGISLMEPGGNGAARTYVEGSGTGESADLQHTAAVLAPEESQRLRMTDGSLVVESGDGFQGLLSPLSGHGFRTFVLLPILCKEKMAGVLAMGYGKGTARAREDILRARQIADQVAVALDNTGLIEELAVLNLGAMTALARAVDAKSHWTAGHSERVTALSMRIGRAMGMAPWELNGLQRGGLLHDLGKIGVPGTILDKSEKLTEEEFATIMEHPEKGIRILEPIPAFRDIIPIVAQHHEWVNGRGYPRGLSGDGISRGARIVAVADVYDALTSDRPYRSGWLPERALSYIEENAGVQFDPEVVEAFRDLFSAGDTVVCIRRDDRIACPGV